MKISWSQPREIPAKVPSSPSLKSCTLLPHRSNRPLESLSDCTTDLQGIGHTFCIRKWAEYFELSWIQTLPQHAAQVSSFSSGQMPDKSCRMLLHQFSLKLERCCRVSLDLVSWILYSFLGYRDYHRRDIGRQCIKNCILVYYCKFAVQGDFIKNWFEVISLSEVSNCCECLSSHLLLS